MWGWNKTAEALLLMQFYLHRTRIFNNLMSIMKWAILAFLKSYLIVDLFHFHFTFCTLMHRKVLNCCSLWMMRVAELERTHRRPNRPVLTGAVHRSGAEQVCSAGRRSSCAAGRIPAQCCPKWWSCTGTRLRTVVVTSWGSSLTPGSATAPAALHCTRDGTPMPGMELQCQGSAQPRSWSSAVQWGNWGMEGLLPPTSTLCHNSCPALLCPSLTAPLQFFLHSIGTVSKILFPSNIENITRRALLFMLDLWNPFYQNRSISCFKLLPNFPFKVA